ncbi:alpha/beta hydrolase [Capillimicrobium parvum]|uniref:3-dehydroquinate dehydratase n=1 Tax=Capillimicrobium parvum TaxID=2884022 RepID=A0A9E7C2C7_9ACTN|nr:alpha/beta hydrolase [Capillimicrobium parvum]UGS38430.1 hypothetical protein DSM104329_04858 [Capillimicrobium parvum]
MTPRIDLIEGPDTGVDPETLRRLCRSWEPALGAELSVVFCQTDEDLKMALGRARADARGVLVNPGRATVRDMDGPLVARVDLNAAERPRGGDPAAIEVRGRGVMGYRWAAAWLLRRLQSPCEVVPYGPQRDQVGDLRLPASVAKAVPVAVLLHGGFWRERWERDTIEPLAIDLARRGFATWNLEYRRVGRVGGGWPSVRDDVAAGIDHLADLAGRHPLDLDRVVFVGHSAGGQLALWAVRRLGLDRPPAVRAGLVVSLAGIADVAECARRGLGEGADAAADLMGSPPGACPDAYAEASPRAALPLGVAQLVVQGEREATPDLMDLNATYVRAAQRAGDDVELLLRPEADHFDLVDPRSLAWCETAARVCAALGVPA